MADQFSEEDLDRFMAAKSPDYMQAHLDLRCRYCGWVATRIEPGDSLWIMARTVQGHVCS